MPKLAGLTLTDHLDSIFSIGETDSIYSYPIKKIYHANDNFDFSVKLFGKTAATPLGPAAGPHTQLAHNILLSYLAGSRIIELKTVQILDHLEIPRPCIDIRNIGYNIEWSQELSLDDSFREYLHAWILLYVIKEKQLLGPPGINPFYDFIFDASIGYNLKGIQSERVQVWLNNIRNAGPAISEAINQLPNRYRDLKEIEIPSAISDSVTLSTFHGCPPEEIEKIAKHLIKINRFNVILKLNPTLLGYQTVHDLLINKLGYSNIELIKSAFGNDLKMDQAVTMLHRLIRFAEIHNRKVGVKFTNTLIVKNNEKIFSEPERYLSGPPLYVLAMNCMYKFREQVDSSIPVSYSGGINKHNFADAIGCNMAPITACTDILKKGGYTRFKTYLDSLQTAMEEVGVNTIDSFINKRANAAGSESVIQSGLINTDKLLDQITKETRYSQAQNCSQPKVINTKLEMFDCINCSICIGVCPNAAIFYFSTEPGEEKFTNYEIEDNEYKPVDFQILSLNKIQQIGVIAEFCNECGNCNTFCPEIGAPYKEKPLFYIYRYNFESPENSDGFHFAAPNKLLIKNSNTYSELSFDPVKEIYILREKNCAIHFDKKNNIIFFKKNTDIKDKLVINIKPYIIAKIILNHNMRSADNFPLCIRKKLQ